MGKYILHLMYDQMGRFEYDTFVINEESIDKDDLLASLIDPVNPQFIRFKDAYGSWHVFPANKLVELHGHTHDPKNDVDEGDEWKLGLGSADEENGPT